MEAKPLKSLLRNYPLPFAISFLIVSFYFFSTVLNIAGYSVFGSGVPISMSAGFLSANLPWIIALSLPAAILLSTIVAFSKSNVDAQLQQMTLSSLLIPLLVISIFLCAVLFFHYDQLVPYGNLKAKSLSIQLVRLQQLSENDPYATDSYDLSPASEREMSWSQMRRSLQEIQMNYVYPNDDTKMDLIHRRSQEFNSEIHKRFSLSITPFLFAFLGAPIGFLTRRQHTLFAYTIGLLIVSAHWFSLKFVGMQVFRTRDWEYSALLWWPLDLILLIAAGILYLRAKKKIHTLRLDKSGFAP